MISDKKVEEALSYIAHNAEPLANARARVKYLDHKRKVIRATKFAECTSYNNVAERESYAEKHQEYIDNLEAFKEAVYDAELIATKMKAAELVVQVWQTQSANNRRANVT